MKLRILGLLLALPLMLPAAKQKKPAVVAKAGPAKVNKSSEKAAKQLVKQANALEKKGDLVGARDLYLKAEGMCSTKEGAKGLQKVRAAVHKKVESLISNASTSYNAKDYARAATTLEGARQLEAGNNTVLFNLALARSQEGNRAEAVALLDACLETVHNERQREKIEQMRASLATGEQAGAIPASGKATVQAVNKNIGEIKTSTDDEDDADSSKEICAQLKSAESVVSKSPAVLFNLAKCAEEEGREEDAIRYFSQYNAAAPNAIDVDDVQMRLDLLKSLNALKDGPGPKVQALYAAALRDVESRHYKRALDDYQQAAQLMPQFAESYRKLAILSEAMGRVDEAQEHYYQYLVAETSPERKAQVETLRNALPAKKQNYDKIIAEVRKSLVELMERHFINDEVVAQDYALDVCMKAAEKLQQAAAIFPLAPEVNGLKSFAYEQTNNFRGMRNSLDALNASKPAFFYGSIVSDSQDKKSTKMGKFELDNGEMRFAAISLYDPKKKRSSMVTPGPGSDGYAEFVTGGTLGGARFNGLIVRAESVKKLETRNASIYVELDKRHLMIEPLHLAAEGAYVGPAGRRFFNNYTRMFQRYMGLDNAKLGKEKMTLGEKVNLGLTLAAAAWSAYSAVSSLSNIGGTVRVLMAVTSATGATVAQLQKYVLEQRQLVAGIQFKTIPSEPVSFAFVNDLK